MKQPANFPNSLQRTWGLTGTMGNLTGTLHITEMPVHKNSLSMGEGCGVLATLMFKFHYDYLNVFYAF